MKSYYLKFGCLFAVGLAVVILLEGCSTVPVTGRRQLSLVSSDQEVQLGLTSFEQLKSSTPISHDPKANDMVQRVGKRLAAVSSNDLPDAKWEFVVFENAEANAFCLPGGKVGVYTGLLPIARDDAGLATVLGHEIGHAVAHHGAERMSEALVLQGAGQLVGTAVATKNPAYVDATMVAWGVGSKVGRELPHDRKQESEADEVGIIYMAKAGYDPKAAVDFWQRFAAYNKEKGGQSSFLNRFMSTHPLDETRIQHLKELLPKAEAEFAKSKMR